MNEYEQMKKQLSFFQKSLIPILFVGLLAIGSLGSFYTVQPDEKAVIIRLGKYHSTQSSGFHWKVPFGIDQKFIIKTELIHQMEFGFRTVRTRRSSRTIYSPEGYGDESLMLTGDLNVAQVEWVVQYRINDPFKYLFSSRSPEKTLRDVSESIMRRVVGDKLVSEVLTTGRAQISAKAKELSQGILDGYDVGLRIVSVQLQDVSPPESVKQAFNEVNEAKQEQEKLINQAEEQYNKVIPNARGKAEEKISRAEGYGEALINRSLGDANKFESVLREYKKAPSITRKRIYIETMEELFKNIEKMTIVDSKVKGLLPIFNSKAGQ